MGLMGRQHGNQDKNGEVTWELGIVIDISGLSSAC